MLYRLINRLGRILVPIIIAASFIALAMLSSYEQFKINQQKHIGVPNNISDSLERKQRSAIRLSRNSAVNVLSVSEEGYISSSSGTYLLMNDKHYVLTVGHAIVGDCNSIRIMYDGFMAKCIEIKLIDHMTDYAIIETERIPNRVPIKSPKLKNTDWDRALSIQNGIYYTGYPNGLGQLTISGKIVGLDGGHNLYVHSFAWPGSSGSGVFSESGDLVGIIVAISVGATDFGVDVLEDMVIVIPLYKINWDML